MVVFGCRKNIHRKSNQSDKKKSPGHSQKFAVCKSRRTPQAANFFVLFEFTIENSQISNPQPTNAPILQKSARCSSSDPAPPSRFGGNCLIGFAKYAAAVSVAAGLRRAIMTAAVLSPSLARGVIQSLRVRGKNSIYCQPKRYGRQKKYPSICRLQSVF